MDVEAVEVQPETREFQQVIALWGANRSTLGFLPLGAFVEHARARRLIALIDTERRVVGYVAYRVARRWAAIIHLCVDEPFRGRKVPSRLVDEIRQRTSALDGIRLFCRQDYSANEMWPRLGFVRTGEQKGRGAEPKILVGWSLPNHNPDLFSAVKPPESSPRAVVALDANVFIDLVDNDNADEEVRALQADWLEDYLDLRVTEELWNELGGVPDAERRLRLDREARTFGTIPCKADAFRENLRGLQAALVSDDGPRKNESDLRQLARAAGGEADVFVTRDEWILKRADEIYETCNGLQVKRPSELVIEIDAVVREVEFRPSRYRGGRFTRQRYVGDGDDLAADFVRAGLQERKRDLERRLRTFVSAPRDVAVEVVRDASEHVAVVVLDRREPGRLLVPVLRAKPGPLCGSLLRSLLVDTLLVAAREQVPFVQVTDPAVQPELTPALEEFDFRASDSDWSRAVLTGLRSVSELVDPESASAATSAPDVRTWIEGAVSDATRRHPTASPGFHAALEQTLWPLKLIDATIPSYLVPIKPNWARRLIDPTIGPPELFPHADLDAFRVEGAYYTATARTFETPARVIWYVSGEAAGYAVGCSMLQEVVVDQPKSLFRRFRRLGVFAWRDIQQSANGRDRLTSLRFSRTTVFPRRVPLEELRTLLPGPAAANFVGPERVDPSGFIAVCRAGGL